MRYMSDRTAENKKNIGEKRWTDVSMRTVMVCGMISVCSTLLFCGCGKKAENAPEQSQPAIEFSQDESGKIGVEYDSNGERKVEESEGHEITQMGETFTAIKERDARILVDELFSGTNLSAQYDQEIDRRGDYFYLYDVKDGERKLAQQIAVDVLSGEIHTYDPKEHMILPYDEFEMYDSNKDADIKWEGVYVMDASSDEEEAPLKLRILALEPGSVEVTVLKGEKRESVGVAYMNSYTEAKLAIGSDEYLMKLDGAELTVQADKATKSGLEGIYILTGEAVE